jgi:threonine dehydrogenase-like Zn-dependent dehydrogenase
MKVSQDGHIMGRVVIPGGCEIKTRFAAAIGNLDIRSSARTGPGYHDDAYEQGVDYPKVFVQWTARRNIEEFYKSVVKGLIDVKTLITHTFPLEEGAEACNLLVDNPSEALGVVLIP